MPYVMVPVPEEHVEEVMQFMLRSMARANLTEWDAEGIDELFKGLDEFGRSLLAFVGRAAAADKDLPETDTARMLQLSVRETIAVVREINELCREADRPALVNRRSIAEIQPNGRSVDVLVFSMEPDHADMVNAAVDAERAAAPDPLAGNAGE